MGYYVDLQEANFIIPSDNKQAAYEAACELNNRNELKQGGRHPRKSTSSSTPHEDVWFSWMDWNYPETCGNLKEVLNELGFEVGETQEGDLSILYYSNKTGQEDLFIEAIAPFAVEGSYLIWHGEQGELWMQVVKDGRLQTKEGKVVFE